MFKQLVNLLKLRIGVIMMLTALVAMVVTPGQSLSGVQILVLAFAVLISAGSAGAFNQYFEIDLDSVMSRTKDRPFVTGSFHKSPLWILFILALLGAGVGSAALFLNEAAAMYIFLGAFFYAIVYTVLLKRRTWMNIVIGGASGSFAVRTCRRRGSRPGAECDTHFAGSGIVLLDTFTLLEFGHRQTSGLCQSRCADVTGGYRRQAHSSCGVGKYIDTCRYFDHAVFLWFKLALSCRCG